MKAYSPVFATMEQYDLVLNLHGEVPGSLPSDHTSLEEAFLPELKRLHEKFPRLRCVLEASKLSSLTAQCDTDALQHCSTAAALDAVRACGPSVAGSFFYSYSWLLNSMITLVCFHFCCHSPKTYGFCRNHYGTSPLPDRGY